MKKPGKGTARRALMVALLLLMSCSGNGRTDRAHRPETGKEANGVITKRYEQIYANPGLNSGQSFVAGTTGEDVTRFTYNDTTVVGGARSLLAVDNRRVLIDFGEVFFAVNLPHKTTLGFHLKSTRTFLRLLEAGIFIYVDNFQLVRTTFDRFKEEATEDYFINGLGNYSELVCLWPAESTFVAGVQNWGTPADRRPSFALLSKEYQSLDMQWKIDVPGKVVRPPFNPSGTAALLYNGNIALIDPTGARNDIDSGEFLPLTACFGPDDLLYAVLRTDAGTLLRVYDAGGAPAWSVDLSVDTPSQPPIVGADGSVYLIGNGTITAIKDREVAWQEPLTGESAAGTLDGAGKLLVSDGTRVVCFEPDGEPAWEYDDPDNEIWRTPPVVLENGAVVVASDRSIVVIK